MARKIAIVDLREAGEDGGDLMGYFARGHHDRHDFADAANVHTGAASGWDLRWVIAARVRHEWWRTTPLAGEPGCYQYLGATPGTRGAFPVTVWDDMSRRDLRAHREYMRGVRQGIAEGANWAIQQFGWDTEPQKLLLERWKARKPEMDEGIIYG